MEGRKGESKERQTDKLPETGICITIIVPSFLSLMNHFKNLAFSLTSVYILGMYRNAGMYSCLLKFDLQLAVSLAQYILLAVCCSL